MAVLGIFFAMVSMVLSMAMRHSGEVQEQSVLQSEARAAVDAMAADLRQAVSGDAANPPAAAIETMTATTIQFLSPDRATPFHMRRIGYQVVGGKLDRRLSTSTNTTGYPWTFPALSAWATQVGSVKNTDVFTYLDSSGAVTTTAANVSSVTIKLVLAAKANASRTTTYSTSVTLRAN
jgi:type II secretory pathway pseudopilin PulG